MTRAVHAFMVAREQLAYGTISSPISGRLGVQAVDRGNVVNADDTGLKPVECCVSK